MYWPTKEAETSLAAYLRMFESLGFGQCGSESPEPGFTKIAIYVDVEGNFLHVAKQLESGRWSSKCGGESDISHITAELLEGQEYGRVWGYLRRPNPSAF